MSRKVHVGLIQASTPFEESWSVEKIKSVTPASEMIAMSETKRSRRRARRYRSPMRYSNRIEGSRELCFLTDAAFATL